MTIQRASSKLFTPLPLGDGTITLKHRMYVLLHPVHGADGNSVMAPLTRRRSPHHVPTEIVGEYYEQRASEGGLLISEGVLISPMVVAWTRNIPRWTDSCGRRGIMLMFRGFGQKNKL